MSLTLGVSLVFPISQAWATNSLSVLSQKQQTSPIKGTEWRTGSNRKTALPTTEQDVVCLLRVQNNNGQLSHSSRLCFHVTHKLISCNIAPLNACLAISPSLIARGLTTALINIHDRLKFAASIKIEHFWNRILNSVTTMCRWRRNLICKVIHTQNSFGD